MTESADQDGFTISRDIVVEWGHCDPAGIVFNPRFFEFFDWSTALLLEAATGMPKAALLDAHRLHGIPLVTTQASFTRPARYGERIEIVSTVIDVGRSSFAIRHQVFNATELSVEARERRVWAGRDPVDAARMKASPIPDDIARRLRDPNLSARQLSCAVPRSPRAQRPRPA